MIDLLSFLKDVFIMGHLERDSYQPTLNISVMPWATKNLAPSIWHEVSFSKKYNLPTKMKFTEMGPYV
jgi:hypothetical protein